MDHSFALDRAARKQSYETPEKRDAAPVFAPSAALAPSESAESNDQVAVAGHGVHGSAQKALSFPEGMPARETQATLDGLLREHKQLREGLHGSMPREQRVAAMHRLDEIEKLYKAKVLENPDPGSDGHLQLGLEEFMDHLGRLSPDLSMALRSAGDGPLALADDFLSKGLNFPLAMILAEQDDQRLLAIGRLLKVASGQSASRMAPEQFQALKQYGFYIKDDKLVNLLTGQALSPAELDTLCRLLSLAADGHGLQAKAGLPGFKALGQVAGQLATAMSDLEALDVARGELDKMVADLDKARVHLNRSKLLFDSTKAEIAGSDAELRQHEAELDLLAAIENQPHPQVPRAQQGLWQKMLSREQVEIVRASESAAPIYRYQGQEIKTGPLVSLLRQRVRARLERLGVRLEGLFDVLGNIRLQLAGAIAIAAAQEKRVEAGKAKVQARQAQADSSLAVVQPAGRQPALWLLLPADLRRDLELRIQQLSRRHAEQSAKAAASLQQASLMLERSRQSRHLAEAALEQSEGDPSRMSRLQAIAKALLEQLARLAQAARPARGQQTEEQAIKAPAGATLTPRPERLNAQAVSEKQEERRLRAALRAEQKAAELGRRFAEQQLLQREADRNDHRSKLEAFDARRREGVSDLLRGDQPA